MIHDGTNWRGYKSADDAARGFALSGDAGTDPNGPIVSASEPTEQSDKLDLVHGDIWVDTSDLENYPVIKRYESIDNSATEHMGYN